MARLLIGSSNVYRNYVTSKHNKKYGDYTVIRCTDIDSFEANMVGLEENDKEVVMSVIENFIDKAGRGIAEPDDKDRAVEAVMIRYLQIIKDAATRLKKLKFVIIEPILRLWLWRFDR